MADRDVQRSMTTWHDFASEFGGIGSRGLTGAYDEGQADLIGHNIRTAVSVIAEVEIDCFS
jgi:hypothetical protein